MTIIIVPTERCNLRCGYCFEPENQRSQGLELKYSFDVIKKSLLEVWAGPYNGSDVCLHGGECLLTPLPELEKLISLIYNLPWDKAGTPKGVVSMVTNATLITPAHIALFKKYNVHVGISVDGPPSLNLLRGPDPKDSIATSEYNRDVAATLKALRDAGVGVGIMCILHKYNAGTKEKRQQLGGWLLELKKMGITGGRLNPVSSDTHPEWELSNDELHQMWVNAESWNEKYDLQWNPLIEMKGNVSGENVKPKPCIFSQCDIFNTHTLSILPDGTIGCCDRTFSKGIYLRSGKMGSSGRYEALQQTDCKGCRYWSICSGGCPEEAIGGDWRRKTRWCGAIYKTYERLEKRHGFKAPPKPVATPDAPWNTPHGDSPHGDAPHGDSTHGDSHHGDSVHGDSAHADDADWRRK